MNLIKKYFYYIVPAFFLGGVLSSCNLDINDNPDASNRTTMEEVMPVVLFYGAQLNYDHAEYGAFLSQMLTTGGRSQSGTLAYKSGWEFLTMNRHPQWRRHYYDIGVNVNELIKMAKSQDARNYQLIGETVLLMSTLYTTDAFGDIPLSEAWNDEKIAPKYDSQEEVYAYLKTNIKRLIENYNDTLYTENVQNRRISSRNDRIYAGDLEKWKGFAYGLMARIYLRDLPNNITPAVCDTIINAVNLALETWEEPLYKYDSGVNEQNCPWGPSQPVVNSWESRKNELDGAIITKFFAEEILALDNPSSIGRDPRAERIMKMRAGPESDPAVAYRYLESNFGMEAAYTAKNYPDLYSNQSGDPVVFTRNDSYIPYMLTEELLLMKAEAQYWKGDKAEAYKTTKEAAIHNMRRHSVTENRIGYYFSRTDLLPEQSFNIGHLMRQKYICMYLQAEQWTDMRRYKYSSTTNTNSYDGGVAIYPNLRRPYNLYEAYWGDDKNAWVQRLNYDPETEEKYNKGELVRLDAFQNPKWLRKPMIWAE